MLNVSTLWIQGALHLNERAASLHTRDGPAARGVAAWLLHERFGLAGRAVLVCSARAEEGPPGRAGGLL